MDEGKFTPPVDKEDLALLESLKREIEERRRVHSRGMLTSWLALHRSIKEMVSDPRHAVQHATTRLNAPPPYLQDSEESDPEPEHDADSIDSVIALGYYRERRPGEKRIKRVKKTENTDNPN